MSKKRSQYERYRENKGICNCKNIIYRLIKVQGVAKKTRTFRTRRLRTPEKSNKTLKEKLTLY